MSLTFLTLVPVMLMGCWLLAEFRSRTWVRVVAGIAAFVTIAIMAFLWGGFSEAYKHAEFLEPHDSPADRRLMDAAGSNGISMRISGTNAIIRSKNTPDGTGVAPSGTTNK